MTGKQIAHYGILEKLGEGGMGVVYKARDTHLDRLVAIKVLPPEKVADAERKRRFVQEAKAASALNHPNIIHVYDISSDGGVDFIAMEYVAGKTLDQLIPRKGMRLNVALKIASQIADALARAHPAGIVHRDLKPSNVMVDEHGLVKVLDFGLAKLGPRQPSTEDDATRTLAAHTDEGMIVGTAAYMSPEQAEGKPVDSRSDIFSFGALLYEMVSGRRAFQRDSPMSTLSAVLREEPKPLEEVPHDVEKLITRCLRKDPVRRWQAMADLRVALRELCEESDSQPAGALPPPVKRDRRKLLAALLALPLLAAAGWLLFQYAGRKPPPPRLVHLTSYSGFEMYPSFSPDGRQVAFTWGGEKGDNWDIYVKLVGESNALRLTTDPAAEFWPAWSPEGKRIAFQRSGPGAFGIWLVSPLGGAEQKLADVRVTGQMSWSPDGKWLAVAREISPSNVGDAGGLFLAPADGGEPRRLTNPKAPASDVHPSFSPSERLVAYVSCTSLWICDVFVQPLDSGYSPRGDPRRITRQGLYIGGLAWSRDGRSLIYSGSLSWGTTPRLWRVAIGGRKQPERLDLADIMATSPSVAPAGGRLAFSRSSGKQEVWRYRIGGVPEPFLTSSLGDGNPQFSPDGGRIVFVSSRTEVREIWVVNADGSRPVQLTKEIGRAQGTPRWSPDGRLIAFDSQDQDGQSHIYVVDANGGRPRRVGSGTSSDFVPSFSRDGKWIYFYSDRTGRHEVWRVPLGEGVARQMTENGGSVAFESTDGRTLFYWRNGRLFARSLDGGPERQVLDNVWAFAVFDDGIYYIGRPGPDQQHPIQFHEFSTGAGRLLTKVDGSLPADRFSVSPDRKTILFTKWTSLGADLMLIENFR